MRSTTALQGLSDSGIYVASDTAEYHQIPEFRIDLSDATTNPSLVLAAVTKQPYAHITEEAVNHELNKHPEASPKEIAGYAMDRVLAQVGANISRIVPGRVSVSVDPRLAYDTPAMIRKGETLAALLESLGIPRNRILIKIPATYEGILAAETLEHPDREQQPIHTNMTLIFGRVQAIACAQAGVSVISPFIGRVKDWWDSQGESSSKEISQHPGILLVRNIRSTYSALGYSTQIMAAGFRTVEEIVELGKHGVAGGPDLVTLPPHLLSGLRSRNVVDPVVEFHPVSVDMDATTTYFGSSNAHDPSLYARDILEEKIAAVKVAEGLAKFSADAQILEDVLRQKVMDLGTGASALL
ncbi:transaldolase [Favolaschia claudopus]|uniref:Transaldolase n=1 Tax=Favolaschia claudopus TaxID=2862362 RepID=A0AAW0D5H0_9AGAR